MTGGYDNNWITPGGENIQIFKQIIIPPRFFFCTMIHVLL